ncbi:MAG: nicotinate-nucleotide adenylyltransferase [Kiloniellales bacterium]
MSRALPSSADLAAALGGFLPPPRFRVGLLGGSFNPAHEGHRAISRLALAKLGLDEVWWLVSPQNPLKDANGMAPLAKRLDGARRAARHPRIRVSALETRLGTRYTADSLKALLRRFPRVDFVWLMGADNLIQISHWQNWTSIFHLLPVAVFDRPTYSLRALAAKSARRFARQRFGAKRAKALPGHKPPAWMFIHGRLNPQSATAIRARRKEGTGSAGQGRPQPSRGAKGP